MQSSKVRTGPYTSGATKVYAARSASFAGAPRTKTSLLAKPASGWAFPCFHLSLSHRLEIGRNAPLALLIGEDRRGDPADAFGVGEGVDLHDLAVTDGEPHHGERLTVKGDDDASPSIGQGGV